jgi:hypothetical protein
VFITLRPHRWQISCETPRNQDRAGFSGLSHMACSINEVIILVYR